MITYDKTKKQLVIPKGFYPTAQVDCEPAIELAYQEGYESGVTYMQPQVNRAYNSGVTAGIAEQKSRLGSITVSANNFTYRTENGWSAVTVDVPQTVISGHIESQKLIALDYSTPQGFSGDETYLPTSGYDAMESVRVTGLSAAQYHSDVYNSAEGAYGAVYNAITLSAATLNVTENGTYTASGETRVDYLGHTWYVPQNFKQVVVDVPLSDICVSGSFTTNADYTFSHSDENLQYIFNLEVIRCLQNLEVDGTPLQRYCDLGTTLPAGSHTFWGNIGSMMLLKKSPITYNNTFPNLSGSITYSDIYQ